MQHYHKIDEQAKHIDEPGIGNYYLFFNRNNENGLAWNHLSVLQPNSPILNDN